MKVKELIKALQKANPERDVFIFYEGLPYDFTGVGYDDIGDVELYVCSGDKAV